MNCPSTHHLLNHKENDGADTSPSSDNEADDDNKPIWPRHNVSNVLDYPMRYTRSGLRCDRGGTTPCLEHNGGGGASAMLVIDDKYPPVTFLVGLPNGIQLAQLPDP